MRINEGNIFEAMRLVLPEHRDVTNGWLQERSVRIRPMLSEDELQDMHYVLSEAIERRSRVRLTLFGEYGDTVLEGLPVFEGGLKIRVSGDVHIVDVGRIIKVEKRDE